MAEVKKIIDEIAVELSNEVEEKIKKEMMEAVREHDFKTLEKHSLMVSRHRFINKHGLPEHELQDETSMHVELILLKACKHHDTETIDKFIRHNCEEFVSLRVLLLCHCYIYYFMENLNDDVQHDIWLAISERLTKT